MHPGFLIEDEDKILIDIWAAYRRGGMGGAGYLPFAGGYAQQPAALMKALESMDGANARITEKIK